jgi:hypothetical protein
VKVTIVEDHITDGEIIVTVYIDGKSASGNLGLSLDQWNTIYEWCDDPLEALTAEEYKRREE